MLKKILFADLDDTLFQSRRKCPDGVPLAPMAYLKDGTAHSFATSAQESLLTLMQREMTVIPVTARNADALSRVRLPFAYGAVVNYGGVILDTERRPDEEWLAYSRGLSHDSLPHLHAVSKTVSALASMAGVALRVRIISDFEVPFYVCAKSEEGNESALDTVEPLVRRHCQEGGLRMAVHRNGNNLSVLPHWLDKRHAVERLIGRLRREHGEIVTFGMGDSLSDVAFMSVCDYALVPRASQINARMGAL